MTRPDVVVVGGGLVGVCAAHRLARAGAAVTLVDPGGSGSATAAGAGIIAPGSWFPRPDVMLPLVMASVEHYAVLLADLATDGFEDTGYAVTGALHVAVDDDEAEALAGVLEQARDRQAAGFPNVGEARLVDRDETRALFPALSEAVCAAVLIPGSARVDGRRLRAALAAACERHGVVCIRGTARLERDGDRVRVLVDGRDVGGEVAVLAAGAWSGELAAAAGVTVPVWPQRGQIVHLAMPGTGTGGWPIVLGFHSHYLLTFPPDRVVAGATHECAGTDERVTAGGVTEVLGDALRLAPGLADATFAEARVGFRPVMPDDTPVLGRAPGIENLLIATGHGSYGLQLGPFSGAMVADMALGRDVAIDLAAFDPGRFSPGS